ncbi:MAG: hypothetical protein LBD58_07545 [Treponema sp.]|jgi:hypothetical protein|nr:hypothetical protein [Treponema sp.]
MKIKISGILGAFSIFLFFFLNACNDASLDSVVLFPLSSYEMNVFLADKRQSIDSKPIINSGDTLRPYFVYSLPKEYSDIMGFQIFLRPTDMRTASGAIREEKLEYMFMHSTDTEDREAVPVKIWAKNLEYTLDPIDVAADETGIFDVADGEDSLAEEISAGADEEDVPAETEETSFVHWTENKPIFVPARTMELPAFTLPETLDIGQYAMILQVVGKDGTLLSSTEKLFYFLAEARFAVKDPQVYLPGQSDARMAKAGAYILLEVPVLWDEPLDPYVVWSDGGKIFHEGRVSEGANRMLWKAPELAGFKNIRAEVFPLPPFEGTQKVNGIAGTISIPITMKEVENGHFAEKLNEFTHWYALHGDLLDKKGGPPLQFQTETTAQWAPAAYTYGLSIGKDGYLISKPPPMEINMEEESGGDGQQENLPARTDKLEFRLKLVEDGTIIRAYYDYATDGASPSSVMVSVVSKDGWLELLVNAGEEDALIKAIRLPAIKPASRPDAEKLASTISGDDDGEKTEIENHNFPLLSLIITTEEIYLCADISFEGHTEPYTEPTVLADPLRGTATFYLGSGDDNAASGGVVAVINELGVLFDLPAKSHIQQPPTVEEETAPPETGDPPPPPDLVRMRQEAMDTI